ncbi:MAG TPA: dodecin family protein [Actinomycetota bacterium]|nr:dodecin family protein [Actinomycetota bacterium]
MGVYNTIELEGVSHEGWGDAAREALREASKTIRRITKMDVIGTSCTMKDNAIDEYRTAVRLYFEIERRGI